MKKKNLMLMILTVISNFLGDYGKSRSRKSNRETKETVQHPKENERGDIEVET